MAGVTRNGSIGNQVGLPCWICSIPRKYSRNWQGHNEQEKNWISNELESSVIGNTSTLCIGFANFYWRFIKDFSKICILIRETLKGDKTKFHWGPKQDEAFTELKTQFVTAPILEHFYSDRATVVEMEASDFALRCVLSLFNEKRLHPVAFHSRKLNPGQRNYKIHEKELVTILAAFKKWKPVSGWSR